MSIHAASDDLQLLLKTLPDSLREKLAGLPNEGLLEIVMDLGRMPQARYVDRVVILAETPVTRPDLNYVVNLVGEFGADNRAGIEGTLHRISAIRNRKGEIIGLTLRVGRTVTGTIDLIRDLVESGRSLLLLGRPGVGKTTKLREVARVLADDFGKRVVVIDTSNEIGGDGDVPHPAIGNARRMQVPHPDKQHAVMIEAVENHMPEVIVIDEIGTAAEALAARTIAERGVQLIGTAHGNTLVNLIQNPTLSDLVGGVQTVTLGDEEARLRGTQKTVSERKAPPTFDVVVEIQDWDRVAVREDVAAAVDALLRGRNMPAQIRVRHPDGEIEEMKESLPKPEFTPSEERPTPLRIASRGDFAPLRVYPYGLNQSRLRQASRTLNLPVLIVNELDEADALFTLRTYYRKRPQAIVDAERHGIPVYVLRNNTAVQMESYLAQIFGLRREEDALQEAIEETQRALELLRTGARSSVQLSPQEASVRRMQHEMAREANMLSRSSGKEPMRRVTIYSDR